MGVPKENVVKEDFACCNRDVIVPEEEVVGKQDGTVS